MKIVDCCTSAETPSLPRSQDDNQGLIWALGCALRRQLWVKQTRKVKYRSQLDESFIALAECRGTANAVREARPAATAVIAKL